MANPIPEIMPDETKEGGRSSLIGGRSDFPNQINNVLVFPGIFRRTLDSRACDIIDDIQITVAKGLSAVIPSDELDADHIILYAFNKDIVETVTKAVRNAAEK